MEVSKYATQVLKNHLLQVGEEINYHGTSLSEHMKRRRESLRAEGFKLSAALKSAKEDREHKRTAILSKRVWIKEREKEVEVLNNLHKLLNCLKERIQSLSNKKPKPVPSQIQTDEVAERQLQQERLEDCSVRIPQCCAEMEIFITRNRANRNLKFKLESDGLDKWQVVLLDNKNTVMCDVYPDDLEMVKEYLRNCRVNLF